MHNTTMQQNTKNIIIIMKVHKEDMIIFYFKLYGESKESRP